MTHAIGSSSLRLPRAHHLLWLGAVATDLDPAAVLHCVAVHFPGALMPVIAVPFGNACSRPYSHEGSIWQNKAMADFVNIVSKVRLIFVVCLVLCGSSVEGLCGQI